MIGGAQGGTGSSERRAWDPCHTGLALERPSFSSNLCYAWWEIRRFTSWTNFKGNDENKIIANNYVPLLPIKIHCCLLVWSQDGKMSQRPNPHFLRLKNTVFWVPLQCPGRNTPESERLSPHSSIPFFPPESLLFIYSPGTSIKIRIDHVISFLKFFQWLHL